MGEKQALPVGKNIPSEEGKTKKGEQHSPLGTSSTSFRSSSTTPSSEVVGQHWVSIPRHELNIALGHLLEMMHLLLHVVFPNQREAGGKDVGGTKAASFFSALQDPPSSPPEEEEEEGTKRNHKDHLLSDAASCVLHPNTLYWICWRNPAKALLSTTTTTTTRRRPPPSFPLSTSSKGEVLFSFHWTERVGWWRATDRHDDTVEKVEKGGKKIWYSSTTPKAQQKTAMAPLRPMPVKAHATPSSSFSSSFVLYRMVLEPHGDRSTIALYEETGTSFFSCGGGEAEEEIRPRRQAASPTIPTPPPPTPRRLPFFLAPTFTHWFRQEPLSESLLLFSLLVREVVAMLGRLVEEHQQAPFGRRQDAALSSCPEAGGGGHSSPPLSDALEEEEKQPWTRAEGLHSFSTDPPGHHKHDDTTTPKKREVGKTDAEGSTSRSGGLQMKRKKKEENGVGTTAGASPSFAAATAASPPSSFFFPPPFEIALDGSINGLSVEREAQTQEHYWTLALRRLLMMVQWCLYTAIQLSQCKRSSS